MIINNYARYGQIDNFLHELWFWFFILAVMIFWISSVYLVSSADRCVKDIGLFMLKYIDSSLVILGFIFLIIGKFQNISKRISVLEERMINSTFLSKESVISAYSLFQNSRTLTQEDIARLQLNQPNNFQPTSQTLPH